MTMYKTDDSWACKLKIPSKQKNPTVKIIIQGLYCCLYYIMIKMTVMGEEGCLKFYLKNV